MRVHAWLAQVPIAILVLACIVRQSSSFVIRGHWPITAETYRRESIACVDKAVR